MNGMRVDASAQGAVSVTPSDTVNITLPNGTAATKGIYVGVTGNLSVLMADNTTVTFTFLPAGVFHPLAVRRVNSTSTTATGIIAVY